MSCAAALVPCMCPSLPQHPVQLLETLPKHSGNCHLLILGLCCITVVVCAELKKSLRLFTKGLDGLGAMGDIGWYCIGNILMAFGWEAPQLVQAAAGACCLVGRST